MRRRTDCQLCARPLTGQQRRWCSDTCATLWHNPHYFAAELWFEQDGLCGICLTALPGPPGPGPTYPAVQVDHVVPLAVGGTRKKTNLRATHPACNQAKKDRSLLAVRHRMGITASVTAERLARATPAARALLAAAPAEGNPPPAAWTRAEQGKLRI